MKANLSMKTGWSVFAAVVVAVMLFEHVRGVESQNQSERQTDLAFVPDAENSVATSAQTSGDQPENPKAVSGEAADPGIAIRSSAKAFVTAFDRGDAAAIAGLWTADGEYLDDAGNRFSGRKAIEQEYVRFFAEHPGAKIEIKIDAIRLIGADAAIEDGHAVLTLPHSPAQPASPYTAIHARQGNEWLMASVREPRVEHRVADGPLSSLDWLVGSWRSEQHGTLMEVTYRWVANHSFLERTYAVRQGGRTTASGVQLIGQEPGSHDLQSWSFTSDAGYAVGTWIPQETGWAIATRGKSPDGTTTAAVNYLTRLDRDTLTWQSRERRAGGVSLPDTAEIRLMRGTASQ